jgi:reversibly glycosylated polypeptide/UDP-arabinopyranose mutase
MKKMNPKAAIVVPTIREKQFNDNFGHWHSKLVEGECANSKTILSGKEFPYKLIVVEDNAERSFPKMAGWDHYCWQDINGCLGKDNWIIPRRSDCVRSFGYLQAYKSGAPYIITLDDDCLVENPFEFINKHIEKLESEVISQRWQTSLILPQGQPFFTRGIPYLNQAQKMKVAINHGLWNETLDFDAAEQLVQARRGVSRIEISPENYRFSHFDRSYYFPMCGMNLSWRREVTPAMYFLLMGSMWDEVSQTPQKLPFDRFGDIWCGIIVKKICDHLNFAVTNGEPIVQHTRASNPFTNLAKEAPALDINEKFWQAVDETRMLGSSFSECYKEIATTLMFNKEPFNSHEKYFEELRAAMVIWLNYFGE